RLVGAGRRDVPVRHLQRAVAAARGRLQLVGAGPPFGDGHVPAAAEPEYRVQQLVGRAGGAGGAGGQRGAGAVVGGGLVQRGRHDVVESVGLHAPAAAGVVDGDGDGVALVELGGDAGPQDRDGDRDAGVHTRVRGRGPGVVAGVGDRRDRGDPAGAGGVPGDGEQDRGVDRDGLVERQRDFVF